MLSDFTQTGFMLTKRHFVNIKHTTAIIPLFLCACATTPCPPPAISVRTVEVVKPVPVACVKPEQVPAMPPRVGDDLTGDAQRDLDVVAASAIRLRAALDQALALLGACQ